MSIISYSFLYFCLVTLIVYYALDRKAQNIWLLLASAFYFWTWGWIHFIPLIIVGMTTYFVGLLFKRTNNKNWLFVGILTNVLVIILFRTVNSPLIQTLNNLPAVSSPTFSLAEFIPLGLSFYLLQAISYLLDINQEKIQPETDFFDFFLYLMFFPKILAGPIERAGNFLPQLKNGRTVDNQLFSEGLAWILIGLFRKIAIAEILLAILPTNYIHAPILNTHPELGLLSLPYYSYVETISWIDRFVGIIGYGIYLYNDFAGYTSIIRGLGLLFGIRISRNFNTPYLSVTLSDFWNRWHISLSSWLRDYVYFPLARYFKRKPNFNNSIYSIFIPVLSVMLISSIWHGLTFPLLFWGLTYAAIMALEQVLFQKFPVIRSFQQKWFPKFISRIVTFFIVIFAWIPFVANSMDEVFTFTKTILKGSGWNIPSQISIFVILPILFSFALDILQNKTGEDAFFLKWPIVLRASTLVVMSVIIYLSSIWASPQVIKMFVYQGF